MPRANLIHLYWTSERADHAADWFDQYDPVAPTCYACGWGCPTAGPGDFTGFHRGHLIDHATGGSSAVSNLVLLCQSCNMSMPVFYPGEESNAIDWIRYHHPWSVIGLAKAHDVLRYVDHTGALPPWLLRNLASGTKARLIVALKDYLGSTLHEAIANVDRADQHGSPPTEVL